MPSTDEFDRQSPSYRESVLPVSVSRRLSIEAGVTGGWHKYVGSNGAVVGLDTFGESGPAEKVFEHFGFTTTNIVEKARALLA